MEKYTKSQRHKENQMEKEIIKLREAAKRAVEKRRAKKRAGT